MYAHAGCKLQLRRDNKDDLQHVLDIVMSHQGLQQKVQLILSLMSAVVSYAPERYRAQLRRMASLHNRGAVEVVVKAQSLLEQSLQADLRAVVRRGLQGKSMHLEKVDA